MKKQKGFTLIELLVVIAIIGVLSSVVLASLTSARSKARDSRRISDMRQLRNALQMYFNVNGKYPTCLKPGGSCTTVLQGAGFIPSIPTDPLTGVDYSYAGIGSGTNCSNFHIGTSLENNSDKIMQSGADAAVRTICTGSTADFSGLSYAAGGQPCNTTVGTAQPTAASNGETCYDLESN